MRWIILIFLFSLLFTGLARGQDLSDKEYELLDAAEKGETSKVIELLNDSINPNIQDWYGMGPLHYAAQNGHLLSLKALVLNGAEVDNIDFDDRTALHLAVHFNHLDIAEFLVQNNADVNAVDSYGLTPLFYSSAYGDFLMTDMFLFYSEGKNVTDLQGRTPFLAAVWGGHISIASLLLKYIAGIDEKDDMGNNGIHLAVLNRDLEMIDSLVSWGCDPDEVNSNGYSSVDLAIQEDAPLVVEKLIFHKANLNNTIKKGLNSLDLAMHITQNAEITMMLEAAGAEQNKRISFSQPGISVKINSGFQDAFTTLQMELWEPKYGIGFSLGAAQRLGRLKVLTPLEQNIRYQFRESRTGIFAGIQKQWMLLRINRTNRIGMKIGFDMGFFMGNNKGSENPAEKVWAPIPSGGLYWQTGAWQLGLSGLHMNLKTYQLQALRLGLSLSYRFNELK